ncbi:hypothetical protein [Cellulomonas sp. P5_C6]
MNRRLRLQLIAAVAVALSFIGSAAAYGSWRAAQNVGTNATITSGTIGLTPQWSTALSLTGMWPGETRTGVLQLTQTGDGRWQYQLDPPAVTGALAGNLAVALRTSTGPTAAACTATAQPVSTWSATIANGASVYVCVVVTLSSTAPSSLQAQTGSLALTATARNQSTY